MEDHCPDEVRYMCMDRPIAPRTKEAPDKYTESPLSMFLDIPKGDLGKVGARKGLEVFR